MPSFSSPQLPEARMNASETGFWLQSVTSALGARKIRASEAGVTSVAKQLARLAATAALGDSENTALTTDAATAFTLALTACSGK
jgi:hypothetical protein